MTIEYFVFKTARYLTLISVIIMLFLKYYAMPDMVAVNFNKYNSVSGFLPKDQFFYLTTAILISINLFSPILIAIVKKLPYTFFEKFNGRMQNSKATKEIIENWINLTMALVNILILLSILVLAKLNSTEYINNVSDFKWLAYFGIISLIAILIYPIFKWIFISPISVND